MRKTAKYLELKLKDEIIEGKPEYTLLSRKSKTDLKTILDVLQRAGEDSHIAALVLKINHPNLGWARLQNIRDALIAFKSSGKPTVAFMESGGNGEYLLASACDTICIPPSGSLDVTGLQADAIFLKGSLDLVGVKAELGQLGKYKAAGEIFTRETMSEAFREEMNAILDDLYEQIVKAVAEQRGHDPNHIRRMIDEGPFTAREAFEHELVDKLVYEDELETILEEKLGRQVKKVLWDRYKIRESIFLRLLPRRIPKIALIHVVGMIVSGESRRAANQRPVAGSETVIQLLRSAKENKSVKAIVLRINSPGGSALASDLIWHEINRTREKKPVIVSFGDTAASGGYYIAVAADKIVAEPSTITGSIGVVAGKFVLRDLLDKLGIKRESITRGQSAGFHSYFKPYSEEEWAKLLKQMREFYYNDFIKKVAQGRRMSDEAIERIAQGRVWTGNQAKAIGLVDEIGGVERAIEWAKVAANLPAEKKTDVIYYQKQRKLRDIIPHNLGLGGRILERVPLVGHLLGIWDLYKDEEFIALLPYEITIR